MIVSDHYCVSVCPTAGIESLYHYARTAASCEAAIVIYADGQPSLIRGNDSTTYTIGVCKSFSASLCPILFCLLDSENKVALKSAFDCFNRLLHRVADDVNVKVGGAVVDADIAAVQALHDIYGAIHVHRCRWHREQSIAKADKLTAVDRAQAKSIGAMLERSGGSLVYRGVLKTALADTRAFFPRLRKYLEVSSEERFGIPYRVPVWHDEAMRPFLLTMALDNNVNESFNAVVKRKLGRRLASGHEVKTSRILLLLFFPRYIRTSWKYAPSSMLC